MSELDTSGDGEVDFPEFKALYEGGRVIQPRSILVYIENHYRARKRHLAE